jgi:hypothetical protein
VEHASVLLTCLAHFVCGYTWGKRVRVEVWGIRVWPDIRVVRVGDDAVKEQHPTDSAGICLCKESCDGASDRVANEDEAWVVGRVADFETFSPDLESQLLEITDCRHDVVTVAIRRLLIGGIAVRLTLTIAIVALKVLAAPSRFFWLSVHNVQALLDTAVFQRYAFRGMTESLVPRNFSVASIR